MIDNTFNILNKNSKKDVNQKDDSKDSDKNAKYRKYFWPLRSLPVYTEIHNNEKDFNARFIKPHENYYGIEMGFYFEKPIQAVYNYNMTFHVYISDTHSESWN